MPENREHNQRHENENRGHDQRNEQRTNQGGPTSNTQDLKAREYRDSEGNIHHHTHTSKDMKND